MNDDVNITLGYPWQGHEVGDRVSVDAPTAKRLVRAGVAAYSTAKDATAAGGDPAEAATKRSKT
jgi:hypothetical protein